MQASPQLVRFAEVLLGKYFPEFKTVLDDFQKMEPGDFGEKYPCFELICDDLSEMDDEERAEEDFSPVLLLLYAEDKNLMARVDWAGEDEPGDVAVFVNRMLEARGIPGFSWNTEEFDASLDLENMRRGEYVPLLLKAIDGRLRELDCRLTVFFMGDDSYPFAVLKKDEFAEADRLAWDVYGIFGAENMEEYAPSQALNASEGGDEAGRAGSDHRLVARKIMQLHDSERLECCAALSKDKSLLAVCSTDGLLRLIETKTGNVRTLPLLHSDRCVSLTFSGDGTRLLSPSFDATVRIWDTKTGEQQLKLDMFGAASYGAFSPDNRTIATGLMGPVFITQFWDADGENKSVFEKHKNFVWGIEFLDDNRAISFAADKTPYLLDISSGKSIRAFKGHKNTVYYGKVSSDKTKLLTASEDTTVRLWDLTDEQKTPTVFSHHSATVCFACFSEEEKSFVSADVTGKIMLVDIETGKVKRSFDGHGEMIVSLKISDDHKRLLSAAADGVAILWSLETGRVLAVCHHGSMLAYADFVDTNRFVTLCEADGVLFWEVAEDEANLPEEPKILDLPGPAKNEKVSEEENNPLGQLMAKMTKIVSGMEALHSATSHDGKYSLEADIEKVVRLIDAETRECLHEFGRQDKFDFVGFLGKSHRFHLRSSEAPLGISIWDARSLQPVVSFGGHRDNYKLFPTSMATDESGKLLLYGTSSGKAFLYDTGDGRLIHEFGEESDMMGSGISAVALYPDGSKAVAAKYNGHLYVWCVKTGKLLFMSDKLENHAEKIIVMPNGKLKVRGNLMRQCIVDPEQVEESDYDPSRTTIVSVAPAPVLEPKLTIPSIRGTVCRFAVSPDEKRLAGVGERGDIRIYDTATWKLHRMIDANEFGDGRQDGGRIELCFSADGKTLHVADSEAVRRVSMKKADNSHPGWSLPTEDGWKSSYAIQGKAFSPDGTKIFLCGEGHLAKLYDVQTGELIQRYEFKNKRYELYGPVFSPDGKKIAFTNNASLLRVLDIESGTTGEYPMPKLEAYPLSWSGDSKTILVAVKKKLVFVNAENGAVTREVPIPKGRLGHARLLSNGNLLLGLAFDYRYRLQIVHSETDEILYEKNATGSANCFCIPTILLREETVLLAGGQDISVVDLHDFREKTTVEGFTARLEGAVVVPPSENEMILSDAGTGRVIDLDSGNETGRFSELFILNEKAPISPDGKTILAHHSDEVRIFDIPTRQFIKKFPEYGGNCGSAVSPDFTKIVGGKEETRTVYRIPDGKKLYNLFGVNKRSVESVSFSPDGRLIIMADWSPAVRIFDAANGKLLHERTLDKNDALMPEAGFIGDGSRYFIRHNHKLLEIFDTNTNEMTDSVRKKELPLRQGLIFSPDGTFYIGYKYMQSVEVVDVKSGKTLRSDPIGEKNISSFAPDLPRHRLFYGAVDGTIRVLNVKDWSWTHTIEGIGKKITRLFLSDDGCRLAAQHLTGIEIFDGNDFSRLATIPITSTEQGIIMQSVLFSPNWRRALKLDETSVLVFDLP